MERWLRWHCPPVTGFEIRALAVWGRARYLSVTEASHNTDFHTWMGKKHFCFSQTAESGNRTANSGVKGSGATNHYPRAPAQLIHHVWDTTTYKVITGFAWTFYQRLISDHEIAIEIWGWSGLLSGLQSISLGGDLHFWTVVILIVHVFRRFILFFVLYNIYIIYI